MPKIWKTKQPECWPYFGNRLVEVSNIFKGAHILDIGFGRGTSLLPAARKAGPGGLVIGVDNWQPFIEGVALEIAQRKLENAFVIKMDAAKLGLKDNYFDFVLSGFSYIFGSIEDFYRLLKKGGRFMASSWKWQDDLEWMGEIVQKTVPASEYEDLSDMGTPSEDGRPWVYYRDSEDAVSNLLGNAGFKEIKIITEKKELRYKDEEEWWDIATTSGWQSYIKKIENRGSKIKDKFKDDCFTMISKYKDEKGIKFSRTVMLCSGIK